LVTLQEFLDSHGPAARHIAKHDDVFNECLVLPFDDYVEAYNPLIGTVEGYILMRLKYAAMKYRAKEAKWQQRFGEELPEVTQRGESHHEDPTALHAAMNKLEPDLQLTLEMWAHGYTQTEIADALGSSVRKVRSRIAAGIISLRKELCGEV
jgi:RNA polymerase sigma factor (sigma-70 family)